ncbi:hypothetical protein PIB30_021011 [Stylosanthes scabra]|uniref:Uncharacterized protein n=1 Tax=Stylosanthes scabra TaxID=79078 RepID=A0ABU6T8H9_9FABA|nr:hypothetical protein [Stylosanthes scabra]
MLSIPNVALSVMPEASLTSPTTLISSPITPSSMPTPNMPYPQCLPAIRSNSPTLFPATPSLVLMSSAMTLWRHRACSESYIDCGDRWV